MPGGRLTVSTPPGRSTAAWRGPATRGPTRRGAGCAGDAATRRGRREAADVSRRERAAVTADRQRAATGRRSARCRIDTPDRTRGQSPRCRRTVARPDGPPTGTVEEEP